MALVGWRTEGEQGSEQRKAKGAQEIVSQLGKEEQRTGGREDA
jgi:hypothetical protein